MSDRPRVPDAPPAPPGDTVDVIHGVSVADPYRWLEDGDSPATQAWTKANNDRTRAVLDALPERRRLHARLTELFRAGAATVPAIGGQWVFSLDRWGDLDQAVLAMRAVDLDPGAARAAEPRILIDPHASTGDTTAAIDWFHPSPDGRLVAYGISTGGDERSTLHIIDAASGATLADAIPDTRAASVAWWPGGTGFAYARYPEDDEYHRHIRLHRIGDDPDADEVLFPPPNDPAAWPDVSISRDGRWYLVHVSYGWTRVDVYLIDATTGAATTVIEGVEALTGLEVVGDRLIGSTTLDAPRGRVVAAPLTDPDPARWETLVPEGEAVIDGTAVAAERHLLVASTHAAVARIDRYQLGGDRPWRPEPIPLPTTGSLAGLDADPERELAVFGFTSFAIPPSLWRWTPGRVERWSDLPGTPDADAYRVEQITYESTDGTAVPMFLVRGAGHVDSAATPAVLTGYGGFAATMSPAWNPTAAAWCDAGGLWAVACLRGGSEFGEDWHRAGMREHKQQAFDDFAAAARWLAGHDLTSPDRLAIRGGSNGGLLVAATLVQHPELCRAVHCAVPLTDMVRFPEFLIAKLWVPEYGDPQDPDEFGWLYAYSPYHHVADGTCYPALLVTTAEEDSRVDACHARKFAARVQVATSCPDQRPVLVRIETRAGHGQGKPASKQADEAADVLAFMTWQLE